MLNWQFRLNAVLQHNKKMKAFDCGNPGKRILCNRICVTCQERTFANVQIVKNIGGAKITITPADYWAEELNEGVTPLQVPRTSNITYSFLCDVCNHTFALPIIDCTSRRRWCPFCGRKQLCGDETCEPCFNRSFASIVKPWGSPADHAVDDIDALKIFKGSHGWCEFECSDCGHTFNAQFQAFKSSNWPCSYCSGDLLCKDEDCDWCFEHSFASCPQSEFWSERNENSPRESRKYSNKKFWLVCDNEECNHEFDVQLDSIANRDTWCPYCSTSPKLLCDDEDCVPCHNKSLASFEKVHCLLSDVDPRHFQGDAQGRKQIAVAVRCKRMHQRI